MPTIKFDDRHSMPNESEVNNERHTQTVGMRNDDPNASNQKKPD